jgi:hypothetical protein
MYYVFDVGYVYIIWTCLLYCIFYGRLKSEIKKTILNLGSICEPGKITNYTLFVIHTVLTNSNNYIGWDGVIPYYILFIYVFPFNKWP